MPESPTNATRADGTRYYRGGCVKGMPMVGACARTCGHRALVSDYRDSRHAWEERRETADAGGDHPRMEDDEYAAHHPPPTFKVWLIGLKGRNRRPG